GLESDTSKEVKLRQPSTLEIAINQATLIHSILFPNGPIVSSSTTTSSKHDPHAMDIDNLHIAINNLTNEVNYLARGSNRGNNNTSRPPKLTAEEKAHLVANRGCFRCRKIGHMASQCRTFPSQPQQHSRQFNNIETATTSVPQQATPQPQQGKATSN
ncbi:hypothetical protein BGZ95_007732, partial [Linnemannia exigua]